MIAKTDQMPHGQMLTDYQENWHTQTIYGYGQTRPGDALKIGGVAFALSPQERAAQHVFSGASFGCHEFIDRSFVAPGEHMPRGLHPPEEVSVLAPAAELAAKRFCHAIQNVPLEEHVSGPGLGPMYDVSSFVLRPPVKAAFNKPLRRLCVKSGENRAQNARRTGFRARKPHFQQPVLHRKLIIVD